MWEQDTYLYHSLDFWPPLHLRMVHIKVISILSTIPRHRFWIFDKLCYDWKCWISYTMVDFSSSLWLWLVFGFILVAVGPNGVLNVKNQAVIRSDQNLWQICKLCAANLVASSIWYILPLPKSSPSGRARMGKYVLHGPSQYQNHWKTICVCFLKCWDAHRPFGMTIIWKTFVCFNDFGLLRTPKSLNSLKTIGC